MPGWLAGLPATAPSTGRPRLRVRRAVAIPAWQAEEETQQKGPLPQRPPAATRRDWLPEPADPAR